MEEIQRGLEAFLEKELDVIGSSRRPGRSDASGHRSDRREELLYKLSPLIDVDYYLKHPAAYRRDREYVLLLSDFLLHRRELLKTQESMNERSFEIWAREKFLSREQGPAVLKRCGLNLSFLNLYPTTEPLAY